MTDDEWARLWARAMPLTNRVEALVALRDDHHQAREEVRLLQADGAAKERRIAELRRTTLLARAAHIAEFPEDL